MAAPASSSRPLGWIFVAMLAIALWSWSLSWNEPILDRHEFRQTQTAISAHWLQESGWRLDYETPIFGPPWSIPLEFPIYQVCVATLTRITGLPLDAAGRATSIGFLLLTLPAVYLLAGLLGLNRPQRLLVLAAVLSSPVYLFYGRTFMIETCALCFSTWFLLGIGRAAHDLSLRWATVAAITGMLAALAKVTTFAVFCFPAGGLAWWLAWPHLRGSRSSHASRLRAALLLATPVLLAVVAGTWWVRYSDVLKQANPFSGFLVSQAASPWTWGTLNLRFSGEIWWEAWRNLTRFVLSEGGGVLLLVCFTLVGTRIRRLSAAAGLAFLVGPLLFTNLYYRHDYYYAAVALFLMFAAGLLLATVWESTTLPVRARQLIVATFFATQLLAFYQGYGFNHRRELPRPPPIAEAIRLTVPPGEAVLIYGWDWNTLIPYYAQRRAIMVPGGRERELEVLETILQRLPPASVAGMLIRNVGGDEFIADRTSRLGLNPSPVATSPDGDLYLRADLVANAAKRLGPLASGDLVVNLDQAVAPADPGMKESGPHELDLPFFSPRPNRGLSRFGLAPTTIEDRSVLLAHAPARLYFPLPEGASQVRVQTGIAPAAYQAGETNLTDGIIVELAHVAPTGIRQVLQRREINPVARPADRGRQEIILELPRGLTGELEVHLSPGFMGDISKDWAYLASVRIE